MPSGAKKRKAAKNKMVKGKRDNFNNYATHSQSHHVSVNSQNMEGDDEPKQQLSGIEEGGKVESRSTVRSNISETNPHKQLNHDEHSKQEKVGMEEDFVHIEREDMTSMEDFTRKIASDNDKESHESTSSEGYSTSDTSGSDDESHVLENVETSPPWDANKQIVYASQEGNHSATEANHRVKESAEFVKSDKIEILDYAIESNDGSSDEGEEKAVDLNKNIDSSSQKQVQVTDVVNPLVKEFGLTLESDNDVPVKKEEETASMDESHLPQVVNPSVEEFGPTHESDNDAQVKKEEETASMNDSPVFDVVNLVEEFGPIVESNTHVLETASLNESHVPDVVIPSLESNTHAQEKKEENASMNESPVSDVVNPCVEEFGPTVEPDNDDQAKKVEETAFMKESPVLDVVNPSVEEFGRTVKSYNDDQVKKEEETASMKESPVLDENKATDEIDKIATPVVARKSEFNNLIEETVSVLASINVPSLKKIVHVNGSASVGNSFTSCEVDESVSHGNGEKVSLLTDEIAKIPSTVMDVGTQNQVVQSESNEHGVKTNRSVDSSVESTYVEDPIIPMNEDESSLLSISPSEERAKADDKNECSDSQHLVNSARGTVQTTSWKNCCGIFELFTSGNR